MIEGHVDAYSRTGFGVNRDLGKTAKAARSLDGPIAQPVRVIAGAASPVNPALGDPSSAEASNTRVASDVRMEVLKNVARWVIVEASGRIAGPMIGFLAEIDDTGDRAAPDRSASHSGAS